MQSSPKINSFLIQMQSSPTNQINLKSPSTNTPYKGDPQTMINILNKKLQKKEQLIRYLERKCGDLVIKSSRKLYIQIDKLQSQNRKLKQYLEMYQNYKKQQLKQHKKQQQYVVLSTPTKQSGNKALQCYRQQLLKFNIQQLRELVLAQATQMQKLCIQKQSILSSNKKSFEKQKKHTQRSLKKQQSSNHTDSILQQSIQNFNHTNFALRDTTLNLNLGTINNGFLSGLSTHKKQINIATVKQVIQTQSKYIQTQIKYEDVEIQTLESLEDIQKQQISLNQLKIQNNIIKKQLQKMMEQNKSLREEALYFAQRIQDYCKEIENGQIQNQKKKEQKIRQNYFQGQINNHIVQNYKEILQIFGIDFLLYPHLASHNSLEQNFTSSLDIQQDKLHQKLLHQICNMKMQLTQLIKQYRKIQKQLNQAYLKNYNIQQHIKHQKDYISRIQQYNSRLSLMINQLNQQLMQVSNKQLCLRYQQKRHQNQQSFLDNETIQQVSNKLITKSEQLISKETQQNYENIFKKNVTMVDQNLQVNGNQ